MLGRFSSATLLLWCAVVYLVSSQEKAPQIVVEPLPSVPYKVGEDITLHCHANGNPPPEYSWEKDNVYLNLSGHRVTFQQNGVGSLVIKKPTSDDDGSYRCRASNKFGTAVTIKVQVEKAVIEPFQTVVEPTIRTPIVGEHLVLPCTPPRSFPKGIPYWGYNRPGLPKLENIETDKRVQDDYEGSLYFANILPKDRLVGDRLYLCTVYNRILRYHVNGNDHAIFPRIVPGSQTYYAPRLLWPPYSSSIAVWGKIHKLKCIFGGLPTPNVTWKGPGKSQFPFEVTSEGYGTEIKIANVQLDHEGYYECSAVNHEHAVPVTHRIHLTVQSLPNFRTKPSEHIDRDEESDVDIDCSVNGSPLPTVKILINGKLVNESHFQGRKSLTGDRLRYRNLDISDSQIIQCEAENEHGSILTNIVLKVNAEQPSFMETPRDQKVVKGNSVVFNCHTRGAPKPKVQWMRGDPPEVLSGSRFVVDSSGSLEIRDAGLDDTEKYTCHAHNKHGNNDASAQLTVRLPTKIRSNPENKVVNANDPFVLSCDVTTDPEELANLNVVWHRDGKPVDFGKERHLYFNRTDFSLRSKNSKVKDTSKYTCHADNGLDRADSEASTLTVRDRPDPPRDVAILRCDSTNAVITWLAGGDNNDPIDEFTVHYGNGHSRHNATVERPRSGEFSADAVHQISVPLRPWSNYEFAVTATNHMGTSDPAGPKPPNDVCKTESVPPFRNPNGVCGKLTKHERQLVIVWEPLLEEERNGDGFHYIVGYRLHNSAERFQERRMNDVSASELDIRDLEPFTQYEIFVQSANNKGKKELRSGEKKITYSGEGKPKVKPTNFRLRNLRNGTYAEFLWDPVDASSDQIRGFFRGYRIDFWKQDDPKNIRSEDVLFNATFDLCRPLYDDVEEPGPNRRRRHRIHIRAAEFGEGATNRLWPNARLSAGVQVLNQAQNGPLSNTIDFDTPEGVPGPVAHLRVIESGSSHLRVDWDFPLEPNGVIVGYQLEYVVAQAIAKTHVRAIDDPLQTSYKIMKLDHSTKYQIQVAALTSSGLGERETVFGETRPAGAPDAPVIRAVERTPDSANISWSPAEKHPADRPGSVFRVEYQRIEPRDDSVVVVDHSPDQDGNWVNVTNLEPGRYEFVVVASSSEGEHEPEKETRSKPWIVYIGPNTTGTVTDKPARPHEEPLVFHHASTNWFIILICIIALLLLILLIVCILRRSRGDMYPVYEKEKMWRHRPLSPDEALFDEYTKPTGKEELNKSQGSLSSEEKPLESDSDSLGEYEDQDASKFNEDGSFIGIYSGKHKGSSGTSSPQSPPINTFV